MATTYNPKTFTNIDSLAGIETALLAQFFKRFPNFFSAHGIHFDNGTINYQQIIPILIKPDASVHQDKETHELMEALQLITELSDQEAMDSLITTAKQQNITLNFGSPSDVAIFCWLNHPALFHTQYAKALVQNFKSFSYFVGRGDKPTEFPECDDTTIKALEADLDKWFTDNNRLAGSRVYFFPHGTRVSIVIKYGMPLKREMKVENGDSESIFYHPQKHDLLIYNCTLDEISVKTDNKKGQEETYLRAIGDHVFGDPDYFNDKKRFSLEKLKEIDNAAYDFATVAGIEEVKLTELQYEWGGETEIRKSQNLLNSLVRRNAQEFSKKAKLTSAKFRMRFTGNNTPRVVRIQAGNQATFGRDDDGLLIEDWINQQGFVDNPAHQENRPQNVEESRAFASA